MDARCGTLLRIGSISSFLLTRNGVRLMLGTNTYSRASVGTAGSQVCRTHYDSWKEDVIFRIVLAVGGIPEI